MKKISTLLFLVTASLTVLAQTPTNKIVLTNGQQIKFVSTIKGNIGMDMMGQTMETLMDISNSRSITVKDILNNEYKLDAVTTHTKLSMSAMGQDRSFDSDNKDDMKGEMKDAGKKINVVKKIILTTGGKCKDDEKISPEKTEEDNNPMTAMMQQMFGEGLEAATTESYFMLIPEGKKVGDSWSDSVIAGTTKTFWNYTWDSNSENTALIKATGKLTTNNTVNTQGMDIAMNIATDITETRKIDFKTGIILNKITTGKLTGTAEVMGQSLPMTGTTTTTVTAQ